MAKRYHRVETHSGEREGIRISRDICTETISIAGWFDSFVSVEPVEMSTRDFLKQLGFKGYVLDIAAPMTY